MRNYNNMNRVNANPVIEEQIVEEQIVEEQTVEEPVIEEDIIEEPVVLKTGTVVNCSRLNVREEPNANAYVVAIINVKDTVTINEEESTKDFYKISAAPSIEGYCMKKYIAL